MDQPADTNQSHDDNPTQWSQQQALELWKYYEGMAATDKNTMVAVEAVLVGFLSVTIGYAGATLLGFQPVSTTLAPKGFIPVFGMMISATEILKAIGVALLGIVIACVAAYVALLYGGYSNWNWAKAATIAGEQAEQYPKWHELLHKTEKGIIKKEAAGEASYLFTRATRFGQPCDPNTELPPIFRLYTWLAIGAMVIHFSIIILSIALFVSCG